MEHKGIEYKILRTTTERIWLWLVALPEFAPIRGRATSVTEASEAAKRAIEEWLNSSTADETHFQRPQTSKSG